MKDTFLYHGGIPQDYFYGQNIFPHKCPICEGHGIVSAGFYNRTADQKEYTTSSAANEPCRACSGTGIIWR